ncbi:hypothetical protein, variant [Aphanomyces astaci]|uniref:HIT domain-containing protein n=1 Tax=Aphanomyces astaci TaxID=112090 RepID=W4GFH1_APHAT|nr:hypothetical protein, variant [Aphanomyces astaci]ETV78011.1 hypothetical protein, variant [Aphanomyces astaci]|eukprot:XP_009832348.1 hypothetical protein, variant [Aphanomyces astaci]
MLQRLAQFVTQRNIRLVLLDLTSCHPSSSLDVAVPALVKCGFRVGVLTSPANATAALVRTTTDATISSSVFRSTQHETFFQDATTFLQVSSDRTLSFRPPGIVAVGNVAIDDVLRDVDMDTPDAFVQALLGFPHALDPHWTQFGPYPIRQSEVFYTSTLSVGLVNLKPIVPGHVLVIPKRRVARFLDLDGDEVADLWHAAQHVAKRLQAHYNAEAYTFSIQDGAVAGQTVPHCHIHVLPRHMHDFRRNDDIYDHVRNVFRYDSPFVIHWQSPWDR